MKPHGSLPFSQEPTSAAYTEPNKSIPHAVILLCFSDPFCQDLRLGFPSGLFHSGFPTTGLYARPTLLMLFDFMFLLIFGKELKLRSWSLCRVERQNL
jgi:hypothetical protein